MLLFVQTAESKPFNFDFKLELFKAAMNDTTPLIHPIIKKSNKNFNTLVMDLLEIRIKVVTNTAAGVEIRRHSTPDR